MDQPAIELNTLRFRWTQGSPAILDIDALAIAPGERVFLCGPSGSGKTTLLNLLGGVMQPEVGQISILGTDITALSGTARDAFRARHVGFIFQQFNLVPYLGLIENVTLPCRFSPERRKAASANGALEAEARRLLEAMQVDVDVLGQRPVATLSVGQQQRVAAARALIGAPGLIIADEPTSSIDADARHAFMELLFNEIQQTRATLVFVSHDAGLANLFDRTIKLAEINRATLTEAA
ncbi:MAG: ABC transporter ATP-binding protein [Pseudomonadota bacterium]